MNSKDIRSTTAMKRENRKDAKVRTALFQYKEHALMHVETSNSDEISDTTMMMKTLLPAYEEPFHLWTCELSVKFRK